MLNGYIDLKHKSKIANFYRIGQVLQAPAVSKIYFEQIFSDIALIII